MSRIIVILFFYLFIEYNIYTKKHFRIRRLSESGIYSLWTSRSNFLEMDDPLYYKDQLQPKPSPYDWNGLTFGRTNGVFILLVIGINTSVAVFLLELIYTPILSVMKKMKIKRRAQIIFRMLYFYLTRSLLRALELLKICFLNSVKVAKIFECEK